MKRFLIGLILAVSSLRFSSCEQTITGVELPYKEQLVIRAVLEEGVSITGIRVERTLPPLEIYSPDRALVANANIVIKNRDKSITLKYKDGFYYTDEMIPIAGETYSLIATWKDKKATATTYIPKTVEFGNIDFEIIEGTYWDGSKQYDALFYTKITPEEKAVYVGSTMFRTWYDYIVYQSDVHRNVEKNSEGHLRVNLLLYNLVNGIKDINNIDSAAIKDLIRSYNPLFNITAYDDAYYSYYVTRYNGESTGDIFGIGGNNVSWNIRGDGIGMFLGVSRSDKEY